jgi:hypothetical protein
VFTLTTAASPKAVYEYWTITYHTTGIQLLGVTILELTDPKYSYVLSVKQDVQLSQAYLAAIHESERRGRFHGALKYRMMAFPPMVQRMITGVRERGGIQRSIVALSRVRGAQPAGTASLNHVKMLQLVLCRIELVTKSNAC